MIVVVGGSGRKAGKTRVIECLLRAIPQARWLAIKVSGHAHGTQDWELTRQEHPDPGTDTGRFLDAGAGDAWWLRAGDSRLSEAVPKLLSLIENFENVIIESNSILDYLSPDLYVFVSGGEGKESAEQWRPRADVVITPGPDGGCEELIALVARKLSERPGR